MDNVNIYDGDFMKPSMVPGRAQSSKVSPCSDCETLRWDYNQEVEFLSNNGNGYKGTSEYRDWAAGVCECDYNNVNKAIVCESVWMLLQYSPAINVFSLTSFKLKQTGNWIFLIVET